MAKKTSPKALQLHLATVTWQRAWNLLVANRFVCSLGICPFLAMFFAIQYITPFLFELKLPLSFGKSIKNVWMVAQFLGNRMV